MLIRQDDTINIFADKCEFLPPAAVRQNADQSKYLSFSLNSLLMSKCQVSNEFER